MGLILKALGGITALILVIITLLGSIVTVGGFLLGAIKILVVAIFVALLIGILFTVIRDRSKQRQSAADF